jgi:membrane protein DedA with SNARE-associated domain
MGEMELYETLRAYTDHPVTLLSLIFFTTFILEDAATLASGLLASYGEINPVAALTVLLAGIVIGDSGLFGLGYLANHFKWAKKLQDRQGAHRLHDWLEDRLFLAVVVARFIPGARLTTYSTVGFFQLSFIKFFSAVLLASALWTTLLFGLINLYGMQVVDNLGPWRWILVAIVIALIFIVPRVLFRLSAQEKTAS